MSMTAMPESIVKPAPMMDSSMLHHHDARVHEVMELAAKIMKSCPLCSHGLDGGLLPTLAIVLVLLMLFLTSPKSVVQSVYRTFHSKSVVFFRPQPHAPPVYS
ncbi:hypothetical protein HYN46_01615 [Aquirhabdus parva]|uniref:DUF2946 domain-containing protein n=2 Tax=Aquirhabdus parva TaxID=2283318 RepID=A0A345P342_9GAMM|nr:hypothetical protein HYN46_01615 [Aquirhabdus parva]